MKNKNHSNPNKCYKVENENSKNRRKKRSPEYSKMRDKTAVSTKLVNVNTIIIMMRVDCS